MTSSAAASRVNRRFLFLALILAGLSAVLVYAAISRGDSGSGVGGEGTSVVVAKAAIAPGTTITADMIAVQVVPESVVGDQPFQTTEDLIGQVARYPIAANEQVLFSKVVGGVNVVDNNVLSHIIEPGKRGMAIDVKQVIIGGGLVLPGDHVDVLWIGDESDVDFEGAGLIAENVEVLAVHQTIVDLPVSAPGAIDGEAPAALTDEERVRASEADPEPDAVTVTLLLTPDQAARIFCADMAAGALRLAVRAFGDDSPSGIQGAICYIPAEDKE
ncbi:MAG: Flp pilus assembly protein CpaB [Chloroflexi bacterium]|nr:Flp pilus assembly protein CpaB [Chloroflexota bacterium]